MGRGRTRINKDKERAKIKEEREWDKSMNYEISITLPCQKFLIPLTDSFLLYYCSSTHSLRPNLLHYTGFVRRVPCVPKVFTVRYLAFPGSPRPKGRRHPLNLSSSIWEISKQSSRSRADPAGSSKCNPGRIRVSLEGSHLGWKMGKSCFIWVDLFSFFKIFIGVD